MENSEKNPRNAQKDLFYKEQQRRLQNAPIKNSNVSADDLIRNILEKVDIFDSNAKSSNLLQRNSQTAPNPVNSQEGHVSVDSKQPATNSLPIPQCFLNNEISAVYQHIWNVSSAKEENTTDLCDRDTSKLYQILLGSNLPSQVLAQLWTHVNRTIPGQLTRGELFIMLALIALIQANHPDPASELYRVTSIPLPQFPQLIIPESTNPFREREQTLLNRASPALLISPISSLPEVQTEPFPVPEEDFADFKSADIIQPTDDPFSSIASQFNLVNSTNVPPIESITEIKPESKSNVVASIDDFNFDFSSSIPVLSDESKLKSEDSSEESPLPPTENSIPVTESKSDNDRYRSLRGLTTATLSDSEEFGDFFSHSTAPNDCDRSPEECTFSPALATTSLKEKTDLTQPQVISNKRKMLTAICRVVQKTFNILIVNHGEESVLEALGSKDGANFANDFSEIIAIGQRINANLSVLNNLSEAGLCNSVFEDISSKWNLIYNLFRKASPNFDADKAHMGAESGLPSGDEYCSICSGTCRNGGSLSFTGFRYHHSCANFWLNFVDASLPHLQYEDF